MDVGVVCSYSVCKAVFGGATVKCSLIQRHVLSPPGQVSSVLPAASGGATVPPAGHQASGPCAGPSAGTVHSDRDCGQAADAR